MAEIQQYLIHNLETLGYKIRIVPFERLEDLKAEIVSLKEQGLIHNELYHEHCARYNCWEPEDSDSARSLVVISVFSPQVRFTFNWKGGKATLIAPPTYIHWQKNDAELDETFSQILEPHDFWIKKAVVPVKLLSAKSGMLTYGRNNIGYIKGFGSFHWMKAFYSNLPHVHEAWNKSSVMARCEHCSSCVGSCPTNAIDPDRFVIHAERCITEWNEKPGHIPFPGWLDTSQHNCLVGCMHCQHACPENRIRRDVYEEGGEFTEKESMILMKGMEKESLPEQLYQKLENYDLLWMYEYLPRNLSAIMN